MRTKRWLHVGDGKWINLARVESIQDGKHGFVLQAASGERIPITDPDLCRVIDCYLMNNQYLGV